MTLLLLHGGGTLLLVLATMQAQAFQHHAPPYRHYRQSYRNTNHHPRSSIYPTTTTGRSTSTTSTAIYYGAQTLDGITVDSATSNAAIDIPSAFNILTADNSAINQAINAAMSRVDQETQRIVSSLDNAEMLLINMPPQGEQQQQQQEVNNREQAQAQAQQARDNTSSEALLQYKLDSVKYEINHALKDKLSKARAEIDSALTGGLSAARSEINRALQEKIQSGQESMDAQMKAKLMQASEEVDHLLTLKIKTTQEELDHSMQRKIDIVNVRIAKMEQDVALQALMRAEEQHRKAFGGHVTAAEENDNPFTQEYLGSVQDAPSMDFAEAPRMSTIADRSQELAAAVAAMEAAQQKGQQLTQREKEEEETNLRAEARAAAQRQLELEAQQREKETQQRAALLRQQQLELEAQQREKEEAQQRAALLRQQQLELEAQQREEEAQQRAALLRQQQLELEAQQREKEEAQQRAALLRQQQLELEAQQREKEEAQQRASLFLQQQQLEQQRQREKEEEVQQRATVAARAAQLQLEQQQEQHDWHTAEISMEEKRHEVAGVSATAAVQENVQEAEVQISQWKKDLAALEAREQEIAREREIAQKQEIDNAQAAVHAAKKKKEVVVPAPVAAKVTKKTTPTTTAVMDADALAKEVGPFSSVRRGVFFGLGAGAGLIVKEVMTKKGAATVSEVESAMENMRSSFSSSMGLEPLAPPPVLPKEQELLQLEPVKVVEPAAPPPFVEEVAMEKVVMVEEPPPPPEEVVTAVVPENPSPIVLSIAAKESIARNFPHSIPQEQFSMDLRNSLSNRGYTTANTIFASSIAPSQSLFVDNMMDAWGLTWRNHYNLGGLGGVPFYGTSGLDSFLQNLPAAGNAVIVFGPHVNVEQDGTVGVKMAGDDLKAVMDAYRDKLRSEMTTSLGAQENFIMSSLETKLREFPPIPGSDALAHVTNLMFFVIKDFLQKQVDVMEQSDTAWNGASEVALVGGVIINTVDGTNNHFHPMSFEIWDGRDGTNA